MLLKRIKILENQLFESLATARKLYSNKIEPRVFDQLISIDPSKTYKYIEKICKFYLQDPLINLDELKQDIELFDKLSSKNLLDIKDINRFKNYSEFSEYLNLNSDKMSKSEEIKLIKNKGTELILNNSKLLVLLIKDMQASIQYGSGTKWCISATDSENYFKPYRKEEVTFYFVFQKNVNSSNPLYKIAVAVYKNGELECYDAEDNTIPNSSVSKQGINMNLFKSVELSKEEIIEGYFSSSYTVDKDGYYSTDGKVRFSDKNLTKLPIKFKNVGGYFYCSYNKLTSLDGCPRYVGENFYCSYNKLTSLDGCPEEVGGSFYCKNNSVKFSKEYVLSVCNVKGKIFV